MTTGDLIKLVLADCEIVGFYQNTENKTVYISPFSHGNYSFGTPKREIKDIIVL